MTGPFDLRGRTALVTGADGGIGHAIALSMADAGAALVIHALHAAAASVAAARLRERGASVRTVAGDFTVDGVADAVMAAAGPIDILVANAAIERRSAWQDVTLAEIDKHVRANFWTSLRLMQLAVPGMVSRGWGRVLTIGSVQQRRPNPRALVYAALKSAQENMVRLIARDVAAAGVTVNNIAPGAVLTPRSEQAFADPAFRTIVERRIPLGRIGVPDDCAGVALMLCSEAGGYVTGADIPVDGGWSINDA